MRKQYFPTVLKSILFVAIMAMQSFSASATCNAHIDNLVIHDLGNNSNTTIVDGATYSLGSLPTNWNVEAIVSGTTIGSVKFTWSGDYSSTNTENAYPYRSPSDAGALNFGAGSYTLTVKVYYEGGCGGSLCDETTIHFTISGCDNVTDPGEIGYAQSECSSFDPTEIVSVHDPSGGSGNLEFVWLKSYDGGSTYSVITGANGLTYDPGVITQTTWFRRCSRRAGCTSYVGESNWVKMAIDPQACFVPIQGELCFNGNDETIVNAQSRWVSQWSTDIDAGTLTVRTTLAKTFVDNTYGTNAVQWPGNGHSFSQLVGSDKLQIALYDNNDNKKMEFKMDYITSTNSAPSGYKTLGVTGGDGGMLTGNASDVVGVKTSLSENFNTYGYVLTTNSPATDNDYTPNPSYPNWDFDVWYEATVKLDVFGSAGFGYPDITAVHASPSKTGHNSEDVTPVPCDNCAGVTISVNASATDVSCNADTIGQCQAVDYQNGSHAIWINTLPNTGQYFRFENGSGSLVEYPDGTAHITGIIYNTVETNKRWQVDVYLNDKMNWTQWQAAGGSWKGTASIVGNNYLDWAYYEMDASQSKLIGLDYYAGKVLNLQRMAAAPQFRVQVGTAANDKNGNYGLSLWYDYSGSFCSSGHGDFNFDLQNCSSQGCDGTATAVASGGTAPYTYSWDNGGSSSTLDGLCAGQYCVTVTDANGCTSDAVCVTVGQQGPCCDNVTDAGQIGVDQSNCGEFDVAELTNISAPSGGTGDLEIVWITRPGTSGTWQMIAGASGLSYDPGVVSVTTQFRRCARRAGCTDYVGESNIITITINPSFTLDCNSSDASAWEASDGTVGVIVNGGTGPFTYLWNTGATTASISNVPAGVYSVTVTDANGCEQWTECCVKQPPVPTVCIGFRTQTQGGWGAVPHGGNPGTYLHDNFSTAFPSGIEIGCNNKFRFTSAQAITDFLPCGGTATSLPSGIATDPACPGNVLAGQVLAATISVGFDNAIPSYSTSTVPLENLIVRYGTFQGWTVGDLLAEANRKLGGCSSSYSYSQLNDAVTAVNENYDDGNVTGNYLDCCTLTASATSTDVTCDTATSHVCEVIPYENGSHAVWFNSLSTGSAYYKFVDGHGTLVEYPDGTAHYSGTVYNTSDNNKKWLVDINLENKKNWTQWSATGGQWKGTASIVGSNYLNWSYYEFAAGSKMVGLGDWAGKELTITQNSNAPQYAVQVGVAANDKNGNYGLSAWFNFVGSGESGHGDFNFDIQNCTDGSCNGTATASAAGGSAPYTYLWDNGATTASLSGLCAGQYCVTVVDATGCKADACVTVGDRPACCNANEPGQIEGSQESCGAFDPETFQSLNPASGGLGDLEYQWYSKTTETSWIPIQGATGETYDAPYTSETTQFKRCARRSGCPEFNVCSNVLEITIHPNNIVATCSSTPAGCNGVASGSVSVYVQGGTSPYAYIWSNGATSTSLNGLAAGTYSVTVTDANGCSTSCQAAVSEPASISVTCTKVDGTCSNNNEGSVSASVSGGTAPFTYSWSNGSTASSISGLAGGTYSVTVTDANGCSATCSKSVSITPCCNVTNGGQIAGGGSHCGPFDPDPITSASLPTGGLGDLEYVWLWNTEDVPNYGNNGWVMIPNSNSPTYDPGMLTESRCFLRCARRSGCATYVGESNRICFTINPEPTANCSKVDGTCANGNQASASVTVTGGTAPFTYAWSNGATTASIQDLTDGTYSVTVTDANGCSDNCSVTVSTVPCCNVTDPGEIAADQNNCGSFDPVEITSVSAPSGGLGDLEIVWITRPGTSGSWTVIPGATGLSYDPGVVTETTQFRRCARRSGCTDYIGESNIITITVYPNDMVANCSSDAVDCHGASTGSATVSVTGGTAPYTVLWSTGATTMVANNLMAGSYSVTVTDANGCSTSCSTDVEEPTVLTATCTKVDGTCNNNNEGSVSVSASGGKAPYTYLWSNGSTSSSISGLAAGTYSVTVTDANGCEATCSKTVSVTPCCNVTNGGQIAGGGSHCGPFDPDPITSASLPTGGLGDLEYVWLWNTEDVPNYGNNGWVMIPNSNSPTYDPGVLTESRCFLRCSRRSGCTTYVGESNRICFTINPEPTANCSKVDGTCANGNQASASVTVTGGTAPFTYAWSNGATTASIQDLTDGTYSVTVTDANGCSDNCSVTVSTVPCCNVTDPGEVAGSQSNCGPFDPVAFTNVTPATGGLGDIVYQWYSKETETAWMPISGANGETYDAPYTSVNTQYKRCAKRASCPEFVVCSNVLEIIIHPDNIIATCSSTPVGCTGASSGSVSVAVQGGTSPYTYLWSNGATTASVNGLAAGNYSVTVTDVNGCTNTCSTTVSEPSVLSATCSGDDVDCYGESTGQVSVAAAGGTAPYTYAWSNGATTASVDNLPAGTYSVTVTDANGCTATCSHQVDQPQAPLSLNCSADDADCNGASTGSANVTATGGHGPYTYAWSNGATTASVSGLAAGNYSVTVTDSKGCTETCNVTVGEPSAVAATCTPTNGTCSNNNEGSVSVSATGGTAPYTYLWSNGSTASSISGLTAGTYSVTVTDANGCTGECSTTVSITPCCNVTNGGQIAGGGSNCGPFDPDPITSASLPTGGLGDLEYVWLWNTEDVPNYGNNGWVEIPNSNSPTYDPGMLTESRCFLRCARRSGCTTYVGESNRICFTVYPDDMVATCTSTDVDCNGASTGSATVSVTGGTAPYTVLWSTGATTMVVNNLMAGSYSVTVTDANGCSTSCSTDVEEPTVLTATCTKVDGTCNNNNEGSVSVSASGGKAPYTYLWSNGSTASSISGLAAGTYSVTVTDANGCEATCSKTVSITPCCNVTNGGQIAGGGSHCGPFDPDPITSASLPTGGLGDLEYVWLWNTEDVPNYGNNGWVMIPNSNSPTYDPGVLTESRCFLRCARRSGCATYVGESNRICFTINPEPTANCSKVDGTCANGNQASASVTVTGGTAPFTYAWSNGATTASIQDLTDGTYSVTVTDANGCSDNCSVTVSTVPCCNVTDPGEVAGTQEGCGPFDPEAFTNVTPATGGLGDIVYQWYSKTTETAWMPIPGANGETYDAPYTSVNTQYKRCAKRASCPEFVVCSDVLEIIIHSVPQVNCTSISGNCSNGNGASASVNVQSGTSPYTYLWSNGGTTQSIGNLAEGTYSVTVTDYFGCTASCSVNVTVEGCCNVTDGGHIAGGQENCGPFDPAAITSVAPATGGIGPVEYVWLWNSQNVPINNGNNGWVEIPNSNSETFDPGMLSESRCFIRCARNQGCTTYIGESNVICMVVNPVPVATCTPVNGDCNNSNSASASVSVSGGTSPYGYLWSNGATTASITGLTDGTYSVTVTDVKGCTTDCSTSVTTNPCCDVTEPGEVAGSQSGCGAFDPDPFTSVAPATGGLGDIVYQWYQKETETAWMPIPGANGETYDPGVISVNSQFKRCAKRTGCPEFEVCSNVLEITIHAAPLATCSKVDGNCNNGNVGSVSVTVQGGTSPYTYLWNNGATTASINGLAAGTYSVTVTDLNGCTATCSKTVEITPCCNVTNGGQIAGGQENCGPFDPDPITSASLPTGGLGDLEYVWLWNTQNVPNYGNNGWVEIPNSNSPTYDPGMITETRCFLRCSRRSGCTTYVGESNIICFVVNDSPVASCSSTDSGCNGSGTGTATVSVTGGEAPYTYAWSNGGTTATISGLMAGSYSVTVTDANGCTDNCTTVVGEPSGLSATCNSTNASCNGENDGSLSVNAAGGSAPYTYLWSNGATTASVDNVGAGSYSVTVTDANGCTATCSSTVGEPSAISATCTKVDGNCQNNNEASVSVAVSGGDEPYTYAWSNGATTASISGLAEGTYSVTVTDANGCTATCSKTVSVTPCCNVTNGGEIAGGGTNCGPFDPDPITSASLPTGGLGDLEYVWLWNTQNVPNYGNNGWVEIPNSNSPTYDPGMLTESRCFLRCSRRSGCTTYVGESNIICFTINPQPVATCSPENGSCNNGNVSSASVSVSGGTEPYAYLWSNGATTASISNLADGTYSVTVTDANGCSDDCSVSVAATPCCNVTEAGEIAGSQENCGPFDPDPITSVAPASGGIGPVEYVWLWNTENVPNYGNNGWVMIPGATGETYDPGMLTESRCFLRCARNQGCETYIGESNIICITINEAPVVSCTSTSGDCNNGNTASASVSASGGTEPYTYLWSNGATTASIDNLATGTYSVTVTDANGCEATCSTSVETTGCCNVTEPGEIGYDQENCGPLDVAELVSIADPSGGLGNLEIVWITRQGMSGPWQMIPGANGLSYDPGVVSVTTQFRRCARREGCSDYVGESNIITITIFPQPEVVCNPTHGDCSNNGMGSVSLTITGGTAPFTYLWSNGSTNAGISNLTAGDYSVTVTDANGCSADCAVTIMSEPCCNVTDGGEIAGSQENCGPFDPDPITSLVPATGGLGPVEYVWLWNTENVPNYGNNGWVMIPGANGETYDPGMLTESRCFLRCARNQGCEMYMGESNIICITVNPVPEVFCSEDDGTCANGRVASVYATSSGGTEPYAYLWSNGETTASIDSLAAGTYSVTVTDANGCEATCSKTVAITECCNVTDGGEITGSQENCGPFDPGAITSVTPASGGFGDLEYVWLWNTENVPNYGNNGWVMIPGATGESYDPGMLTESRCFLRCARRSGCEMYMGESNIICITINPVPTVACTPVDGNCGNGNVASASVSASGGTAPYAYLWSNGETTASISNLAEGTYSVTVTDANGCSADCSTSVSITPCCNVTDAGEISGSQESCGPFDPDPITSLAPATGGIGPVEYVWLWNTENVPNYGNNGWQVIPGANGESYDPGMLTESRCFLRCARNQGCETYVGESNIICITIFPALEVECSSISGDCGNGNVASASVDVLNGTAPYTYEWSNGETTAMIDSLAEGTYSVTVTDANGCSATCSESVVITPCCNVTDPGEIAGEQTNCTAFDPDPITSVAPATGGIGPVQYMWLQGDCNTDPNTWTPIPGATGVSYDPGMLTETTCFRRCARNSGCEPWIGESNIITITIQNALTIECSSISGDCGNGNVASASVDVIDGTAPFTYDWSNGETTADITGLAEGTYTVTVTDANGCTASCSESVIVTPCCNVTDPGEIAGGGSNCGAFDPDPITSVAPATGGIGPVQYMWLQGDCNTDPNTWTPIPGATGVSYDPGMLTETTCFRRCARNSGCEPWIGESNIITFTVYPAIQLSCNGLDGNCSNGNVVTAVAHASGGTEPYTISWSNGETTAMIDSLEAGTYTVTVTDVNGCEATCTTTVSVTPCCNVTDGGEIAETQENCGPFDPEPIVSVTPATGGIGPVEYAWYSGPCPGNDPTIGETAIPAGFTLIAGATGESYDPGMVEETTCYIRVARNQGCEEWIGESNIVSIIVNPTPVAQCSSENGTCENGNVGSASVTVSGAPSPFSYAWSNGETTASITGLAEGTYSVVVTDGHGCVDSCTTSVEVVPCCNVTDGGEIDGSQQNCGPFDPDPIVSVTPATGGIGPVEYAWYSGPCQGNDPTIGETAIPAGFTLIPGATGESYDPGLVEETTCYIRVARNHGCTDRVGESNIVSIEVDPTPVVQCSSENGTCENGNLGTASVTVSGSPSPFSYAWSNGGTGANITELAEGTYSVVVTDANGCVDSCSVQVENVGCCNVTDGGQIDGYQENCGPFDPDPIVSITPATGGIGPVEYAWYSGPCPPNDPTINAPTQEAIPAGFTLIPGADGESYDPGMVTENTCYIRVARNHGCTDWIGESNIVSITILDAPDVEVFISGGANPSCSGDVVELTAQSASAVNVEWSTGATSSSIEVTTAGTYVVTVWNEFGCSNMDSIDIDFFPTPEVEIEVSGNNPFCQGDSVLLTAVCQAGDGYQWSTGSTGTSIWVTEAGTYEVEVVDTNGCTASTSVDVEVFELPNVEIMVDGNNPLCDGDSALLTAVSQGAMSYEWNNGSTSESIWVYESGTYTVTVVDEGGCENHTSVEIEQGQTPLLEITGDTVACAGSSIELTAQYAGGEGVLWSNGSTSQTIVVTEAGEYCVSTASVDGCEASTCISIDFYTAPEVAVDVTAGNNPMCPGSEVELTATSQNAVSYVWSTQETSSSITVSQAGSYSVEITDANGCTAEGSIEVEEGQVPLIEITGGTEFCTGDSVMLTAQYAGGEGVTWSTGATTQSIWVSEAGQYCATTASINGCEAHACIEVEEAAIPEVNAGPDINICDGQSTMLTATGGTSGTVYTWYVDGEEVGTGASIVVSPGVGITEYVVVASNENCSISDEDHIKVYVYEYPLAGFERDPAGDVPFGSDVQFTDTTLGNVTDWHWDFGDGLTSMLQNPNHNYADPGSYWVTLIASNNGCTDTATAGLEVKVIIDIPNVFTPNNDGVNDVIWLQGTDLNNISMTIYSRWGHSVYASEGREFMWTGKTTEGVDCEAGTYYYVIQLEYKDGHVSEQTGFFTLLRN